MRFFALLSLVFFGLNAFAQDGDSKTTTDHTNVAKEASDAAAVVKSIYVKPSTSPSPLTPPVADAIESVVDEQEGTSNVLLTKAEPIRHGSGLSNPTSKKPDPKKNPAMADPEIRIYSAPPTVEVGAEPSNPPIEVNDPQSDTEMHHVEVVEPDNQHSAGQISNLEEDSPAKAEEKASAPRSTQATAKSSSLLASSDQSKPFGSLFKSNGPKKSSTPLFKPRPNRPSKSGGLFKKLFKGKVFKRSLP